MWFTVITQVIVIICQGVSLYIHYATHRGWFVVSSSSFYFSLIVLSHFGLLFCCGLDLVQGKQHVFQRRHKTPFFLFFFRNVTACPFFIYAFILAGDTAGKWLLGRVWALWPLQSNLRHRSGNENQEMYYFKVGYLNIHSETNII